MDRHPFSGHRRRAGHVGIERRRAAEARRERQLARYLTINTRFIALQRLSEELDDLRAQVAERSPAHAERVAAIAGDVAALMGSLDRECAVLAQRLRRDYRLETSDLFCDPSGQMEEVGRDPASALRYLDGDGTLAELGLRLVSGWGETTVRLDQGTGFPD